VLLSQAIGVMGGRAAPVLIPYATWLAQISVRALARVTVPAHLADVIAFGSVMDGSHLEAEFGWKPQHSSREVMEGLARGRQLEVVEAPSPPQEYELQVYLQRRRRGERNGLERLAAHS
jgi:hypothetical protein